MRRHLPRLLPIASIAAACILVVTSNSSGDISRPEPQKKADEVAEPGYESIGPDAPLQVQCWQEGREIIDERKLYSMALKPLLEQATASFKTSDAEGPSVHIISVGKTTCLVRSDD